MSLTFQCRLIHVGIRTLQLMLLKIALVLGVKVHVPVVFEHLVEPDPNTGKQHFYRGKTAKNTTIYLLGV